METTLPDVHPFPGYEDQRFATENGDGKPEFLHPRFVLQRMTAPWFKTHIGEWGPAWLMRVVDGPQSGLLLAFTPRGLGPSIEDRFPPGWKPERIDPDPERAFPRGYKPVVLHTLQSPGPGYLGDGSDTYAAGMTVLERL